MCTYYLSVPLRRMATRRAGAHRRGLERCGLEVDIQPVMVDKVRDGSFRAGYPSEAMRSRNCDCEGDMTTTVRSADEFVKMGKSGPEKAFRAVIHELRPPMTSLR